MSNTVMLVSRWAVILVVLSFVNPVIAIAVSYAGFAHQTLGNATLTVFASRLTVDSFSATPMGTGVRVDTLFAEGMASGLGVDPSSFPLGARLTATASGPVNGVGVEAARLEIERTINGYALTPSFPGLGGVSYRIELYLGDDRVHAASDRSGSAGTIAWLGTIAPELLVHRGGALALTGFPDVPAGGGFRLPGGDLVDADRVVFLAEGAVADADYVEALELTVDSLASFFIVGHDLVHFQARHRALGSLLVPSDGALRVEALPTGAGQARGGVDPMGVEIELGDSQGWWLAADGLSPADLPTGAWLHAQTFGTVGDVPDQLAVSTRLEDRGAILEASFDFAPLVPDHGEARYTVEILLDGEMVVAQSGVLGPAAQFSTAPAVLDPWLPSRFPPDPFPPGQLPEHGGRPLLSLLFEAAVPITLAGHSPTIVGNEIRAYPDFDPRPVSRATRLTILTNGLTAFALHEETFIKNQKIFAGLAANLDGWLMTCTDALRPASLAKTFVCLVNRGQQPEPGIEVCAATPKGLTQIGGLNMTMQQNQTWSSGSLSVPARGHCPVGLEGTVALPPYDHLESEFTIKRGGISTQLRLLNLVLPGSGFLPPHPGIPAECLMVCTQPSAHLCKEPPPSREVFADGFESGDTSAWSASTP